MPPKIINQGAFFFQFRGPVNYSRMKGDQNVFPQASFSSKSSLQALSGFISVSFLLSQPVMTLSRRDRSPLRGGTSWLWYIKATNIVWLTISCSPAALFWLTVWMWLNCQDDRVGDSAGEILPPVIMTDRLPFSLSVLSEGVWVWQMPEVGYKNLKVST